MKKTLVILSVLVALAMLVSACAPAATPTTVPVQPTAAPVQPTSAPAAAKCNIGVSNSFIGSEWRAQMISEMQATAKELGCTLTIESADTDVQGQTQQINNLVNKGVNAIVLNPGDVKALNPVLEDAVSRGIIVIAVDQAIEAKGVYNAVIDQKKWAELSAEWLFQKLGGKGNVTLIEGYVGHPANEARMAGVADMLKKYPDIKVIGRDTGMWDPATAQKVAANFLASLPNIDGMWTQDGMAEGEYLALKAANPAKWPIVVMEARASALRTWKQAITDHPGFDSIGVVNPPAVGEAGVRLAYNLLNGKKIDPAKMGGNGFTFFVPIPGAVTNDTLDAALKSIEGKPDSYTLDAVFTQADADGYFLK